MYREVLGGQLDQLSDHVRRAHQAPLDARGVANVKGPTRPLAKLVAELLGLPRAGEHQEVQVIVSNTPRGQQWDRTFGRRRVVTTQSVRAGSVVESRRGGAMELSVYVEGGDVIYYSVRATLRGMALPHALTPQIKGRVSPTGTGWKVHVEIEMPWVGHL